MIKLNTGCPFCGQVQMVHVEDGASDQDIKNEAIRLCTCDAAEKYKEMHSVRKRVAEMFGIESQKKFDDTFTEEVQEDLIGWAEKVLGGMYDKVVITMENGDKAVIARSRKRIKISREQKVKTEK